MKRLVVLLTTVFVTLGIAVSAMAKGPPPGKGPGGGETAGNNLSVPAIFVPTSTTAGAPTLRVACALTPKDPTGDKSPVYTDYWLQQTDATWGASCADADAATVTADWGDNLTTSPQIRTGKPIRVEVGLLDPSATGMTGYVVTNLTPTVEDRNAVYGTDGTTFTTGDAGAPETRVWDSGAHLTITNSSGENVVDQAMVAEINSTGAVVYGFNWGSKGRVNTPAPGTYTLTFTTSVATTITGIADTAALNVPTWSDHSTSLTITLLPKAGGGNGGSHGNH